jgi:peroxiredoxin
LRFTAALVLLVAAAACADTTPTSGSDLQVGDRAPAFDLPAADGSRAILDDYVGEKPVLLYFSMGPG